MCSVFILFALLLAPAAVHTSGVVVVQEVQAAAGGVKLERHSLLTARVRQVSSSSSSCNRACACCCTGCNCLRAVACNSSCHAPPVCPLLIVLWCAHHSLPFRDFKADLVYASQADVLIGVHSQSLFSAFFMHKHASVIEIRPLNYTGRLPDQYMKVCSAFLRLCLCLACRHAWERHQLAPNPASGSTAACATAVGAAVVKIILSLSESTCPSQRRPCTRQASHSGSHDWKCAT